MKSMFRLAVTLSLCVGLSFGSYELMRCGLLPLEQAVSLAVPGGTSPERTLSDNIYDLVTGSRRILELKEEENDLGQDEPDDSSPSTFPPVVTAKPGGQTSPPPGQEEKYVIQEITVSPRASGSGYDSYGGIFLNNTTSLPADIKEVKSCSPTK